MTRREKTFWTMLKNSILFARQNSKFWTNKSIIVQVLADLEKCERELSKVIQQQKDKDPGGFVDKKNMLLQSFTKKVYCLSCKLSLFAKRTNKPMLLYAVDVNESTFNSRSVMETLKICSNIISHGLEHLPQVEEYGITFHEIDALLVELEEMQRLQTEKNLLMNERKSATREIKHLIAEARILLDELDDAFHGMINDPEFLTDWFDIRKIKGRPRTTKTLNTGNEAA